jgi:hypothetical protein
VHGVWPSWRRREHRFELRAQAGSSQGLDQQRQSRVAHGLHGHGIGLAGEDGQGHGMPQELLHFADDVIG